MYLTLEKFDSYDDGVSFNAKVFQTLEQARAYAKETYDSHIADLVESESKHEWQISLFNKDAIKAPIYYSIDAENNYYFCIQIQKIPDDYAPASGELIELSDSNGI